MTRISRELSADIIEWDIANWARALGFWEKHLPASLQGLRAMEVGARNGGLSLYLALRGCRVFCTDLGAPSENADPLHRKHRVDSLIEYGDVDVTNIIGPDNYYDIVAFKSLLGGVGRGDSKSRQQQAINEIYRVLKPGGHLIFAENLVGSAAHAWARRKFTGWGSAWRYVTIGEIRELTSSFSVFQYRAFGCLGAFGRSEKQRRFLGAIDAAIDPFLKESIKYIVFGYAEK